MFKRCFITLILLIILQSNSCLVSAEEFKQIMSNLANVISEELHLSKQKLDEIIKKVIHLSQEVTHKAPNDINNIVDSGLDQINAFKEGAGDVDHKSLRCIEQKKQEIKDIPKTIVGRFGDCVNEKIDEAKNITKSIISDFSSTGDLVKILQERYDNCGWGFHSLLCYTKVTANAGSQIIQVPIKFGMDVAKARYMIANVTTDLSICAIKVTALAVGKVVVDVVECVAH